MPSKKNVESGAKPNYRGNLYRKFIYLNGSKIAVTAKSEKELNKKIIVKKVAIEKGELILNKNTTVEFWAKKWLEIYKKPKVQQSTYINICGIVKNYIIPEFGHLKLSTVKRTDIQLLLNKNSDKSFSFLTKLRIYINEMFENAERDELIRSNPAKYVEMPDAKKGKTRVLTDEEYNAALEICQTHKAGLWIMIMLKCGLRKGETIPLMWSDVDWENKILSVNKAVQFVKGKAIINNSTKTESGMRVVGIPDSVIKLMKPANPTDLIFTGTETGTILNNRQILRLWNSFKRTLDIKLGAKTYRNKVIESKISGLRIHCLRHTCITRLILDGAEPKQVQIFSGHKDIATTLNIYTHIAPERVAKSLLNLQNGVTDGVTKKDF
ncbi:MAG: site-specific integrase [Endomicrobium sp.]|jgi:integrase|nr:site-specific integrase [Endomicrobium sp.]